MNQILAQARQLAASGAQLAAARLYQQVLDWQPGLLEALMFLARGAMAAGTPAQALRWLRQAQMHHPRHPQVLRSLGIALASNGELEDAEFQLRAALSVDPGMAAARLHLGRVQEQLGQADAALRSYFSAIRTAQARGEWLSDESTPPWLQELVLEAIAKVAQWRSRILDEVLQPHRERYGAAALARVQRALQGYLKPGSETPPEAHQRPRFLYFPGLRSQRWYGAEEIPFSGLLQSAFPAIRAEAAAQWASAQGFAPFLDLSAADRVEDYLGGRQPAWDAYFFYRHGEQYTAHLAACPTTAQVLQSAPLIRIEGHAPEICYSVLKPDTHILPHTGVSNIRLVVHLPLIIPEHCALKVAGEEHHWREGEVMVFDDTFEHEAWNRSGDTRIILLMDAWHPDLDEAERAALADLIEGIGTLNRPTAA